MSSAPDILELLSRATSESRVTLTTPRGTRRTTFADLWELSGRAARNISQHCGPSRVAGIITPSPEMISCFIGSLRSGRDFVSLPGLARAQSSISYSNQIRTSLQLANVEVLVVEEAHKEAMRPLAEASSCSLLVAERVVDGHRSRLPDPEPGKLIQFSSGTTNTAKGIQLSGKAIAANVDSILQALQIDESPETFCSWLPLSHDMGLIGGLLGSWAGSARTKAGYEYICMSPDLFLARPLLWMEICSSAGVSITAAPTFAYDVLSRHLRRASTLDLRAMRACMIGAEPIRAQTLRGFAEAASRSGLRESAICPSYGLAEATLAVSMVSPRRAWNTRVVSVEGRKSEYVSCGPALEGVEIAAPTPEQGAGPISVRGSSLFDGYIPSRSDTSGDWLQTGDWGVLADGELYVTGREDDLLCVAGRNLFAWELEHAVMDVFSVRPGNCAVVPDGRGRYMAFFETRGGGDDLEDVLLQVKRRLVAVAGIGPSTVACVRRGALAKTPSGKLQRNHIAADAMKLIDGSLVHRSF